jgi:hypothetical protein
MNKQPIKILEKGYRPTSGRSVNTANPPKGGSGVPPKDPASHSGQTR